MNKVNNGPWATKDLNVLVEMRSNGNPYAAIGELLNRSTQACSAMHSLLNRAFKLEQSEAISEFLKSKGVGPDSRTAVLALWNQAQVVAPATNGKSHHTMADIATSLDSAFESLKGLMAEAIVLGVESAIASERQAQHQEVERLESQIRDLTQKQAKKNFRGMLSPKFFN